LRDKGDFISEEDQNLMRILDFTTEEQKETYIEDMLFIKTGEDVVDIKLAFMFYRLI
jgi:hypothetical protein